MIFVSGNVGLGKIFYNPSDEIKKIESLFQKSMGEVEISKFMCKFKFWEINQISGRKIHTPVPPSIHL